MIRLYRAISQNEKDDYDEYQEFRTSKNTLEAKQFFKSRIAVKQFVASSVERGYDPPYLYLMIISINEGLYVDANPENMKLDGYDAINIKDDDLTSFNISVTFVDQEVL